MGNIYFTSDTHFGHQNIIKYCARPFSSVDEMNEALISNWNKTVSPNDTVYHLGDFAFVSVDKIDKILQRLNGTINIIVGNHDREISKSISYLTRFNFVVNYFELKLGKDPQNMFVMNHYGQRVWNKSHRGSIHLYGHSHGSLPSFGKSVDVGVDCKEITSEYRPVSVDEVRSFMAKREIEVVDHHDERE
jgi:calcineurin-like phosphoesterase family protein